MQQGKDHQFRNVMFVGVGVMGSRIAPHIRPIAESATVVDSDVAQADAVALSVRGKRGDVTNDAQYSDLVVISLPNSKIVDKVLRGDHENGLLYRVKSGALIIDLSSSEPASSIENARIAEKRSVDFIDAPVSGGVDGAQNATLTIMVGGSEAQFLRAKVVLNLAAKRLFHVGPVGAGDAVKALNNLLSAINGIGTAEIFAIGKRYGIDQRKMLDVVSVSSGRSFYTEVEWPKYLAGKGFDFRAKLLMKDIRIALSIIDSVQSRQKIPLADLASGLWSEVADPASDDADTSIMEALVEKRVCG